MKKLTYTTLLFLLLLTFNNAYSQQPFNLKLSEGMEEPNTSTIIDVISKSPDAYYCLRYHEKNSGMRVVSIEKYDGSPALWGSSEYLELKAEEHDVVYEFSELFEDKLYIYCSYFSAVQGVETLYAFEVNAATLEVNHTPKAVVASNSKKNSVFIHSVSPDEKTFAIMTIPGYDKKDPENPNIYVYNTSMEQLWTKKVEYKVDTNQATFVSMKVSNTGDAHLLSKVYIDPKKFLSTRPADYTLAFESFLNNGKDSTHVSLDLELNRISDVAYKITDDGKIVCGGLYRETKKLASGYKGINFFMIDPAKAEILKQGTQFFSPDELAQFIRTRQTGENKEIELFDLGNLRFRNDGSLVMVIEKYYLACHETLDKQGEVTGRICSYYYLGLMVVSVKPTMNVDWIKTVPKMQVTDDDNGYYSSYTEMLNGGNTYLMYNDNPKNEHVTSSADVEEYTKKKGVVFLVTIDATGNMKKETVMQKEADGIILRPKICPQVKDGPVFIYGEMNDLYNIGVITF